MSEGRVVTPAITPRSICGGGWNWESQFSMRVDMCLTCEPGSGDHTQGFRTFRNCRQPTSK